MVNKTKQKIIAVMPALNVSKTLKKTYKDIPKGLVSKTYLVDDGSTDDTVKVAKNLGIEVISHPQNRGYGGAQKTLYTLALNDNPDVVIMIHPDYQYDSTLSEELVRPITGKRFDIMLGSRIRTRKEALAGGMPFYKYISNRFLTTTENIVLGQNLSEYHTGFRAFSGKVLKIIPFHNFSNDFVFDQETLVSAIYSGFKIGETPVPVRYYSDSSSISFIKSVKYGLETLISLFWYILAVWGFHKKSIFGKNK